MTAVMEIPLLDLNAQYAPIKNDVLKAMNDVFESKQFIMGPKVVELEKAIADYCNANYALGVSSGTDALILALMAMDIGPGDEVITSPFTFFATAGSIHRVGATPVFVDIDPDTFNIDPKRIKEKITKKTKAIMPVHIFGQMADMDPILAIAKEHNLFVIEDAAQAIGSAYTSKDGKTYKAGVMGHVGCFSFFPSKNLGGIGDGGIVTTNDPALAKKMELLRNHGAQQRYYHHMVGGNFRLDTIQAAVVLVKLPTLNDQHEQRRQNAAYYDKHLTGNIKKPVVKSNCYSIYNQYTLRTSNRDKVLAALQASKVGHAVYYPVPLHLQECFAYLGYKEGSIPEAEKASKEVFSIPVYAELTDKQKQYVCDVLNKATV